MILLTDFHSSFTYQSVCSFDFSNLHCVETKYNQITCDLSVANSYFFFVIQILVRNARLPFKLKMNYHCIQWLSAPYCEKKKRKERERYALAFSHPPRFDWIPQYITCRAASLSINLLTVSYDQRIIMLPHADAKLSTKKVDNEFLNGISFRRTKICVQKYSHIYLAATAEAKPWNFAHIHVYGILSENAWASLLNHVRQVSTDEKLKQRRKNKF